MKRNLAVVAALMIGMVLGAAGMAAYYGPIAEITAQVVGRSGGGGPGGQPGMNGTISLHVGQLVAGQHYSFDDVEGYTWMNTGSGGDFDIVLNHNITAFDYVRVKVEISGSSEHGNGSESDVYYEFYLDTNNPSYTVSLPAGMTVEIEISLEEISVSADASPGNYVITIDLFGP
ncbi:MAG: hypothetical protein F7B18_08025 [Desulfurococcales archaeon]|nr:hypothetical protein [Desulfurococcales archaeon]